MTDGEKMVWAFVFADEINKAMHNPPDYVLLPGVDDKWSQWEIDQAVSASEVAYSRVYRMRNALLGVASGFGEESDVYEMLKEMLE